MAIGRLVPPHLGEDGEFLQHYDDSELKLICVFLKPHLGETIKVTTDYPPIKGSTAAMLCTLVGAVAETRGEGGVLILLGPDGLPFSVGKHQRPLFDVALVAPRPSQQRGMTQSGGGTTSVGSDVGDLAAAIKVSQLQGKVPISTHEVITVETTGFGCQVDREDRLNCPDCWLSPSQDKESYGFDTKTFFKHYEGVVREYKKMKAWKETDTTARERLSEKLKDSWPAQVHIHSWMTAGVISDHDLFKLALELYIHNEGPTDNKVKTLLRGKVWQAMVVGKDASPHNDQLAMKRGIRPIKHAKQVDGLYLSVVLCSEGPREGSFAPRDVFVKKQTWASGGAPVEKRPAAPTLSGTHSSGTQAPTQAAPTNAAPTQAAPTQAAPTQAAPTSSGTHSSGTHLKAAPTSKRHPPQESCKGRRWRFLPRLRRRSIDH